MSCRIHLEWDNELPSLPAVSLGPFYQGNTEDKYPNLTFLSLSSSAGFSLVIPAWKPGDIELEMGTMGRK